MTTPIQDAQHRLETNTAQVKRYMPTVGRRIVLNYLILIGVALLVSLTLVPLLMRFVPRSTADALGFAINLLWLVNGWRFLERRNKATGLFAIYTRFSRERRDLEQLLAEGQNKMDEVTAELASKVHLMEATAANFIQMAQAENITPRDDTE